MQTALQSIRLKTLFNTFLGITLFFAMGIITSFAAADDYTVTGGNPASLPNVGAASVALPAITLQDAGGDDFINDPETITIRINTASYPNVAFDSTVTALAMTPAGIGGTCGYNAISGSLTYSSNDQVVSFAIAGGTNCGAGETILIGTSSNSGLKILTTYASSAPAAAGLISVDNESTSLGSAVTTTSTIALGVTAGDAAMSMTLGSGVVGTSTTAVLTFTLSYAMASSDTVVFTMPSNLDVSSLAFASETFSGGGTFSTCAAAAQIVTCTSGGVITAGTGTLTMSGVVPKYAATSQAVTTLAVNDVSAAGADISIDATGSVSTDTTASDAAATITLGNNARVGNTGTTTLNFTLGYAMASSDTVVFTLPSHLNLAGLTSAATDTFAGAGSFTCAASGQVVTCTAGGAITAGTGTIVLSGIYATAAASSQTLTSLAVNDNSASDADISSDSSGSITNVTGSGSSSTASAADLTAPVGFTVSSDDDGVRLEWTDPDDDAVAIEVLRGENGTVSGTPLAVVELGVAYYVDTDVEDGDEFSYALRSKDGNQNKSSLTDIVDFTVGSTETVEADDTTTDDTTTDDTTTDDTTTDDTTTDDTTTDDTTTDDTTTDDETASELFSDEIPEWAEAAITVLANAGVVEGNPDGTFAAADNLNRAEAATMLWRVLQIGNPTGAETAPFTDVALGEWYTDYISSLKGRGLVSGNPDGTYEPGESINRAEFLQMAMNVYMYLNTESELSDTMTTAYADLDTSAWYAQMVSTATEWGFVEGSACDAGTCFNAGNNINRAEASQILYNMFGASL